MANIRLPRLPINWSESPEMFRRYWDEAMSSIEQTLNAILAIPEIEDALAAVAIATEAAQDAADNANAAADGANAEQALISSYPTNATTPPLIQADSTGLVTVSDHDRQYGPGTSGPLVSVDGDTIVSGGVTNDVVRVYYSDPARTGGAVTYLFMLNSVGDPPQGDDIHVVGEVKVPGAGSQDGNGVPPPGYVPLQ